MGTVLMRTGKPAEACEVVKPALTELDAGISDQRVLIGEVELVRGQCLRMAGDTDGSLAAYRRAVDLHIDTLGENDRRSATALNNLALGEMYAGRYEDASGHFRARTQSVRKRRPRQQRPRGQPVQQPRRTEPDPGPAWRGRQLFRPRHPPAPDPGRQSPPRWAHCSATRPAYWR